MRPDHGAIMQHWREQLTAFDGKRPEPRRRVYELRKLVKGWNAEREAYQVQLDEILTTGRSFQPVGENAPPAAGYTCPRYARARIAELDEKLELFSTLDLRTDEEIRGHDRAEYKRSEVTQAKIAEGMARITNEEFLALQERLKRAAAQTRRAQATFERKARIPGSPERLKQYEWKRFFLTTSDEATEHVRREIAKRAIAGKLAERESLPSPAAPLSADASKYIEMLAKLAALDEEYADVAGEGSLPVLVLGGTRDKKRRRRNPKSNQIPPKGPR